MRDFDNLKILMERHDFYKSLRHEIFMLIGEKISSLRKVTWIDSSEYIGGRF